MSASVIPASDEVRAKYERAQRQRAQREMDARLQLTEGRDDLLAGPTFNPPLLDNGRGMTTNQVCEWLSTNKATLLSITKNHETELRRVGFVPGHNHMPNRFSRRAIMHVALLMRTPTERANQIKRRLGVPANVRRRGAHTTSCAAMLPKALEVAEDVKETDPVEVWERLCAMDRWQLQAVIVALGTMVPANATDNQRLRYLTELGSTIPREARLEERNPKWANAARGLALLVTATHDEQCVNDMAAGL